MTKSTSPSSESRLSLTFTSIAQITPRLPRDRKFAFFGRFITTLDTVFYSHFLNSPIQNLFFINYLESLEPTKHAIEKAIHHLKPGEKETKVQEMLFSKGIFDLKSCPKLIEPNGLSLRADWYVYPLILRDVKQELTGKFIEESPDPNLQRHARLLHSYSPISSPITTPQHTPITTPQRTPQTSPIHSPKHSPRYKEIEKGVLHTEARMKILYANDYKVFCNYYGYGSEAGKRSTMGFFAQQAFKAFDTKAKKIQEQQLTQDLFEEELYLLHLIVDAYTIFEYTKASYIKFGTESEFSFKKKSSFDDLIKQLTLLERDWQRSLTPKPRDPELELNDDHEPLVESLEFTLKNLSTKLLPLSDFLSKKIKKMAESLKTDVGNRKKNF